MLLLCVCVSLTWQTDSLHYYFTNKHTHTRDRCSCRTRVTDTLTQSQWTELMHHFLHCSRVVVNHVMIQSSSSAGWAQLICFWRAASLAADCAAHKISKSKSFTTFIPIQHLDNIQNTSSVCHCNPTRHEKIGWLDIYRKRKKWDYNKRMLNAKNEY